MTFISKELGKHSFCAEDRDAVICVYSAAAQNNHKHAAIFFPLNTPTLPVTQHLIQW